MSDSQPAMQVYQLTHLTRDSKRERRVVIKTVDVPYRLVIVSLVGGVLGLLPVVLLTRLIGGFAIFLLPVFIAALYWLTAYRMRSGLHLPLWRHLKDRRKAAIGQLFLCGRPVDPLGFKPGRIVDNTVPVTASTATSEVNR